MIRLCSSVTGEAAIEPDGSPLALIAGTATGAVHRGVDPGASATLAADELADALAVLGSTIDDLASADLSSDAAAQLSRLRQDALAARESGALASAPAVDPAEGELVDALAWAGIGPGQQVASDLAAGGLDQTFVGRVVDAAGPAKDAGLRWIAASLATAAVATELSDAVRRIDGLIDLVPDDLTATHVAGDGPGVLAAAAVSPPPDPLPDRRRRR